MDRIVAAIVRLMCAIAGFAKVLPGVAFDRWSPGQPVKILLVGYNGARNTGSDVRVANLARHLIEAFDPGEIELSVMTLDEESTSVYFDGIARQIPFNTLFFDTLLRVCSESHVIVLCEGSTLKSQFADALTLYNCQAAGIAKAQGKPCIAMGSEIGMMEPYLESAVRELCSEAHFVTRSVQSDSERQRLGLKGHHGTDTAWSFDSSSGRDKAIALLKDAARYKDKPLLGIAPVNPFCWPVRPSLAKYARSIISGDHSLQFQSWYYFSRSELRKERFHAYIDDLAKAALTFCAERDYEPLIFGMEQLDAQACQLLCERMGGDVPIVTSQEIDGFVIAELLRSLSLLVTSRYHAQVLSSAALVPTIAVSMDERLDNLAMELGMESDLLLHVDDPDLAPRLLLALDYAHENHASLSDMLSGTVESAISMLRDMDSWFVDYVRSEFWMEHSF